MLNLVSFLRFAEVKEPGDQVAGVGHKTILISGRDVFHNEPSSVWLNVLACPCTARPCMITKSSHPLKDRTHKPLEEWAKGPVSSISSD